MSEIFQLAADLWGRSAEYHNHNSGPIKKGESSMASVQPITPIRQIEVATIHWLNNSLEKARREVFTDRVIVTSGVANALLGRNAKNRNMSATKSEVYAQDMIAGRWVENGETIIVSDDGQLNDGQHRLQAVIDSNTAIPFLFVFGVPRESRTTVDQGRARGAGDYLSMDGIPYAKNAATACKFIIAYERSDGRNISLRSKLTNAEIVERVKSDPDIIKSAAFAHKHLKSYRVMFSHTVMAACHYILSEVHGAEVEEYLNMVALGENIKRGDPAFAVRQAFLSDKRERQASMEVILRGWNKYNSGSSLRQVKCLGVLPAIV